MAERLSEAQWQILERLARGEPGREGIADGMLLMLSGLTDLTDGGKMVITAAGRRALDAAKER